MPAPHHKDEVAAVSAKDLVLVAFDGVEAIDTLIVAGGEEPAVRKAIARQNVGTWLAQV